MHKWRLWVCKARSSKIQTLDLNVTKPAPFKNSSLACNYIREQDAQTQGKPTTKDYFLLYGHNKLPAKLQRPCSFIQLNTDQVTVHKSGKPLLELDQIIEVLPPHYPKRKSGHKLHQASSHNGFFAGNPLAVYHLKNPKWKKKKKLLEYRYVAL